MRLKIDTEIELALLTSEDAVAIFNTIDSQRDYLGKWLPFVKFTNQLSDSYEGIERQGELLSGNTFTDLMIFSKLKSDR